MTSILDKRFKYVTAIETDISLTFARIREREQMLKDWDEALAEEALRSKPKCRKVLTIGAKS